MVERGHAHEHRDAPRPKVPQGLRRIKTMHPVGACAGPQGSELGHHEAVDVKHRECMQQGVLGLPLPGLVQGLEVCCEGTVGDECALRVPVVPDVNPIMATSSASEGATSTGLAVGAGPPDTRSQHLDEGISASDTRRLRAAAGALGSSGSTTIPAAHAPRSMQRVSTDLCITRAIRVPLG